jgi:hypothetical protein
MRSKSPPACSNEKFCLNDDRSTTCLQALATVTSECANPSPAGGAETAIESLVCRLGITKYLS